MGNEVPKEGLVKDDKQLRADKRLIRRKKHECGKKDTDGGATCASKPEIQETRNWKYQENALKPGMFIQKKTACFSDRYVGVKVLGKGSFGEVILCRDKVTGVECAVKILAKSSVKGGSSASLLREIELLKELDHPNIIKLYEFFEDTGYFYLVTEVYTGGELFDKIVKLKRFDIFDAARTMKQILSGINYMHHNSIVHRDIKPENLLLENDSPDALIKIIDFGLSTFWASSTKMKDKIGTAYYIAPEILEGSYNEKCDIWSAGVVLYILITGRPPFNGSSEASILSRVAAGQYSTRLIFECVKSHREAQCVESLIRHMLMFVPSLRYSAQQCLDHEFITRLCVTDVDFPKELGVLQSAIENVIRFQASQKLCKAALLYMGSKLTSKEETAHLTRIFEKLDRNGDGQLDIGELKAGYKELMRGHIFVDGIFMSSAASFVYEALSAKLCLAMQLKGVDTSKLDKTAIEAELNSIFETIDLDKNGSLSYSEFVTACIDQKILLNKTRLQRAFDMFDVDGSGKICSEELQKIFCITGLNKAESDSIIKSVDANNDGEEFEGMILKLLSIEHVAAVVKEGEDNPVLPRIAA